MNTISRIPRGATIALGLVFAAPAVLAAQRPVTHDDSVRLAGTAPRPLSLDEAVRLAEPHSPVVRIANNAVTRASGQVNQARSGLFPQLNASAAYTRTLASQFQGAFSAPKRDTTTPAGPPGPCARYIYGGDSTTLARVAGLENYARCTTSGGSSGGFGGIDFSKVGFGARNAYTLGLTGSQNLFTGGRLSGQIQAASATRRSAQVELTAQRAQLRLDVATAYYDAALSDRLLEIAQATLAQAQDLLRQTQLQNRVGNISEFDLLRAQVAVNTQRPQAIQAASARDVAYLRLKQLLALPYDVPLALTTSVEDSTVQIPGVDLARAATPDTATGHRAPVREAAEAVRAQRGLLRVARAERIPTLALSSSYSRLAYPNAGLPAWNDFRPNWTVTLGTSFPILTGGRIRGDELVAEANLRDARDRLAQAQDAATLDARVALNTLAQSEATLRASEGTAEQATRAFQIATVRYREGISTQLELNDTRNQLSQALVNRAQAARAVQLARVRLALLPDLPIQTQGAGQQNVSQQQQQQQQIQQQSPPQAAQQVGASSQGAAGGAPGAPQGTSGGAPTTPTGSTP